MHAFQPRRWLQLAGRHENPDPPDSGTPCHNSHHFFTGRPEPLDILNLLYIFVQIYLCTYLRTTENRPPTEYPTSLRPQTPDPIFGTYPNRGLAFCVPAQNHNSRFSNGLRLHTHIARLFWSIRILVPKFRALHKSPIHLTHNTLWPLASQHPRRPPKRSRRGIHHSWILQCLFVLFMAILFQLELVKCAVMIPLSQNT